jgi:hypothetical protein
MRKKCPHNRRKDPCRECGKGGHLRARLKQKADARSAAALASVSTAAKETNATAAAAPPPMSTIAEEANAYHQRLHTTTGSVWACSEDQDEWRNDAAEECGEA